METVEVGRELRVVKVVLTDVVVGERGVVVEALEVGEVKEVRVVEAVATGEVVVIEMS